MSFYAQLSLAYDEIFAVDEAEMAFLKERLQPFDKLLDIGCGTGNKTEHFARPGRQITGLDGDAEMIRLAKARHSPPGVSYEKLGMLEVTQRFAAASFDAVLCLGNTLVHLAGPAQIGRMLEKMRGLLQTPGLAIIQILNYDRILDNKVSELPVLETNGYLFRRRYVRLGETLLFETELHRKNANTVDTNSIPLYPLRRAELEAMIAKAGFGGAEFFGSYQGTPLSAGSFVTIALCRV